MPSLLRLKALCGILCWTFLMYHAFAGGSHNHGIGHQHLHNSRAASSVSFTVSETVSSPIPAPTVVEDAKETVRKALEALAIVNKLRMENINFNKYEFSDSGVTSEDAPPLDIDNPPDEEEARKRSTDSGSFTYSIPEELREAARIVAESMPPATPEGNHEEVAAEIRRKYALRNNDTNVPPQSLLRSDELEDFVPGWEDHAYSASSTDLGDIAKRATSSYWMTTIQQRGSSPFAPEGYKVWRNVKDYGAKGDGTTDDTAAINLAISDGGRCGANCGSSTIYPAVVYFPPGTYLVSSSIIQYYNTQFLGDPITVPTILAASSFVGLGVISSDVYVSDTEEWYINQNNFLRSIKNFKIDVRLTDPYAYICAIHWQVAQGTSLENIEFYALAGTTQQGIYMENGSGGFLSDLTFVGGNFGAFFGNQQFTTSHLVFVNCNTALQIHWDWAWTMQDIIIESCGTGIVIVGGAGGPMSNGQPVGSLIVTDALIANTPTGILSSLYAENSTALLVQNTGFFNVKDAIVDDVLSKPLLAGGDQVFVDNWGFGMVSTKDGVSGFVNGQKVPAMNRTASLLAETGYVNPNFFTRRRPKYYDVGRSQIVDVKALGAKGDGVTDDGPILNVILQNAANLSSIVYFPFGVYVVKDTLKIPVGSRIIGQAWSQIMGKGSKFENELKPRVMVKVGEPGDVGIAEIQDMLFTVSGNTAGAVLMEWNVHESTQGSAGLWDSHFRVGGSIGSELQAEECPKLSGKINSACKAASLLLHLTTQSSAYLENVWLWVADHDLDKVTQDQIDVYVARGVLIESQGPTWLYGMIQTESPYYQPVPKGPLPFTPGIFPNDPSFDDCPSGSTTCALSWAVRIIDSKTVYLLGAGLYSWFSDYSQDCLATENCQQRGFHIEESTDIWIYNLCTKAIAEMITPVKELVTLAKDNRNGFLSSILAWVRMSPDTAIGQRQFEGFRIYSPGSDYIESLTATCQTALTQTIKCHAKLQGWQQPTTRRSLQNTTLTDEICDTGCGRSLRGYYEAVTAACKGQNFTVPAGVTFPERAGGTIWTGYNETCLKDAATDEYCNDVIDTFAIVDSYEDMPHDELCSPCYIELHQMMQSSPYSVYHDSLQSPYLKARLEYIYSHCDVGDGPTAVKDPQYIPIEEDPVSCFTDVTYMTREGDTCDSIALFHSISSATLQSANVDVITNCTSVNPGKQLCIPLTCNKLYILQDEDTCESIEMVADLAPGSLRGYNPWINYFCDNLVSTVWIHGRVLCLSPQGGLYNVTNPIPGVVVAPGDSTGYSSVVVAPPNGTTIAEGTTPYCGKWYTVSSVLETCATVCSLMGLTSDLFRKVNPSLAGDKVEDCTGLLQVGVTYCVGPIWGWDDMDVSE